MTPNQFLIPQSPLAVPPVEPPTSRLCLDRTSRHLGAVDGAWWPRSTDAGDELPGLIAEVDRRLGLKVLRVGLHADAWTDIPHRIPAAGRAVKVGWFRSIDFHVLSLHTANGDNWQLLVIPPGTEAVAAADTFALAADGGVGVRPADILAAGRAVAPLAAQAKQVWETDGGRLAAGPPSRRAARRELCSGRASAVQPS